MFKIRPVMLTVLLLASPGLLLNGPASAAEQATAQDIKRETTELLQALKSYGVEQRETAIARCGEALANIDQRISALETALFEKWDDMDQATRDRTRASLQALREQRTRVAEWYGSLKAGSAGAWDQIKQGFSSAYQALHQAWEQSEGAFDP